MKLIREEAGQTLVFTALLMCCLFGFMALAIDMGVLFRAQRRLQTAADAAAIAAGLASQTGMTVSGCGTGVTSVNCAAYNAAAANGVTDKTQITLNNPPSYGSHTGAEYYEVIINQPNPTVFMAAFSGTLLGGGNSNYKTMTVGARAVSGIVPGQICVYALDPSAADAFDVQGAADVSVPNCTVQIDSDNSTALCSTGSKATISSSGIRIVGAQNPKGKCNKGQPNATTGVAFVGDPFTNLPAPVCNTTGSNINTFSVGGSNPTISSGTQLSNGAGTKVSFAPSTETTGTGPTATTASVVCFSDTNVTIGSGVTLGTSGGNEIFVFLNGAQVGGTATVYGTLYLGGGNFVQGNNALNISAPANTSYTYNGIGMWLPSTNESVTCDNSYKGTAPVGGCLQIQFGSGSFGTSTLDGLIYAPAAAVYMQDNGGGSVVTGLIADEIYDKSSYLEINNNYNYAHAATSPLNHVALVE